MSLPTNSQHQPRIPHRCCSSIRRQIFVEHFANLSCRWYLRTSVDCFEQNNERAGDAQRAIAESRTARISQGNLTFATNERLIGIHSKLNKALWAINLYLRSLRRRQNSLD